MMLDPSIPYNQGRPAPVSGLRTLGQVVTLRRGQQQVQAGQMELDDATAQRAADDKLRALFSQGQPPDPEAIVQAVGPERGLSIINGLAALGGKPRDPKEQLQMARDVARAVISLPPDMREKAHASIAPWAVNVLGLDPKMVGNAYDDAGYQAMANIGEQPKAPPSLMQRDPTRDLVNPQTGAVVSQGTPAVKPSTPVMRLSADKRGLEQVGELPPGAQLVQEAQPARVTVQAGATANDPKDIAEAIMRGDQPPTLTGLYRNAGPVRAELARQGYNLTTAMTDWNAVQKRIATLNGPQQTRLRQAAETAYHSLDIIEDLSKQWEGGRFPLLNKVRLAAAKGGALGTDAQQIATQLEAQISDLTSELGNVYMGGNSPTDHSLGLAAKNLSADWSAPQLKSAIALARKNLQIRLNSIRGTGVIGASEQNPYMPEGGAKTEPAAGGGVSYADYLEAKKK